MKKRTKTRTADTKEAKKELKETLVTLTPATMKDMKVGEKISMFESILEDESRLKDERAEIVADMQELFGEYKLHNGINWYPYMQNYEISVAIETKRNKELNKIVSNFGSYFYNIGFASTFPEVEKVAGKEVADFIREVAEEWQNRNNGGTIDEEATEKLRKANADATSDLKDIDAELTLIRNKKQTAKEFVGYVKQLSDIAKVTS